MDSANGHIASIYNVPVITLWGLTHPYTGFTTFNSDLKNQFCVDREKFPLVPNSVYGNKMIKGYENAMRTISIEEVLGRVTEGKAVMDDPGVLSDEELDEGFILTCISKPDSEEITIDFDDV